MEKTLLQRDRLRIKHKYQKIKANRTNLWKRLNKFKRFLEYLKANNMKK